ncbi:MAG: SprT family zinc-dependent metalloprotease [Dehalococcoidia bacterium]
MIQTNADQIIHSKRNTFCVEIKRDGSLVVRVPQGSSIEAIQSAIDSKTRWILKKRAEIYKMDIPAEPKKFVDGEKFLYLGVIYPLSVDGIESARLLFDGSKFVLSKEHRSNARYVFVEWYREYARRYISKRVREYSSLYNIPYSKICITNAEKRWGSCNNRGSLRFSWRLAMAPRDVIDYVVVHEMAHIKHLNHSRAYWQEVISMMPDFKEKKRWLYRNGNRLVI